MFCVTPNTTIMTPNGTKPVHKIRKGSTVFTRNNGMQEIIRLQNKTLRLDDLIADPDLAPVLIKAGALGAGIPERDLKVSPSQRIFLRIQLDSVLFDSTEALVSAKNLVGRPGVTHLVPNSVTYLHLVFEKDELVLFNGIWCENTKVIEATSCESVSEQTSEVLRVFSKLEQTKI